MKKALQIIFSILISFHLAKAAAPYDTVLNVRNSLGGASSVTLPDPTVDSLLGFNETTHMPFFIHLGTGSDIMFSGGLLKVNSITSGQISDASTAFATFAQGAKADSALQSFTELDPVAGASLTTHAALTTTAHGGIVASSDSRLTNARTPTAHASTHATGGSDPITATSIGADASGAASTAQAFSIQRSNHTGTQSASTITGLATVATSGLYSDLSGLPSRSFTNNPSRTIQTVAAAANGFQASTTQATMVSYSVSISVTATISNASVGYVVLEVCSTNSSTAADWTEISRTTNGQTISLAVILQSVQLSSGTVSGVIQPGYYARLRSVNTSGTPTYGFISGQEVKF